MNTSGAFVLPVILALPVLGALFVMATPRGEASLSRGIGLAVSTITFVFSLLTLRYFDSAEGGYQMVADGTWIASLGIHWKTGLDGISLWLVLLTTFLTPLTLLAATRSIEKHVREFVAAMLVLETGMLGAFVSVDIFLFYVFWEVMLVPMYLMIGIWGGQRRLYASIKFVIYTMVGSLLMLVAIFYLYVQHGQVTGIYTTDLQALTKLVLSHEAQVWCFAAFALAFAIKVPLFPLHTWLPDAHVEAPTPGSVILAGVMLKLGIFGFLRLAMPLFPHGAAVLAPYLAVLAVIGIVYGAVVAFAQDDVKKLVAYSSVSHLGFCVLGLFSLTVSGLEGAIFAMLSHGLTTGGLFLGIGMLYERRHTRRLSEYGGIWKQMPVFSGLFLVITMGSAGLPGLSGFIGEFLALFGTFNAADTFPAGWPHYLPSPRLLGAIATTGVILGAIYLLFMFQKVFFGPLDTEKNGRLPDLSLREKAVFVPLVIMIFVLGVFPRPFLTRMEPSVKAFLSSYHAKLALPDGPARMMGQQVDEAPAVAAAVGAAPAVAGAGDAGADAAAKLRAAAARADAAAGRIGAAAAKAGGQP